MSRARQRRRLLALRRADARIVALTRWTARPPISKALMHRSFQVPARRQWWPR